MALDEGAGAHPAVAGGSLPTDLVISALQRVSFLGEFSQEQLAELAAVGRIITLEAGQEVFRAGDEGGSLYVVLSGAVRIYAHDDEGYEAEVSSRQAGEFFGEIALLDGKPRSASVATTEPSVFFALDRTVFSAFLTRHPTVLTSFITTLTTMVRSTVERVVQEEMTARLLRAEMELDRQRTLGQMVAGVAHEINTPLGTIVTASSILQRALGPEMDAALASTPQARVLLEDATEAVTLIERNARRAHKLIQDFKKISVSQVVDTKERLQLPDALDEIVGLYRLSARTAGLEVAVHCELPVGSAAWEGYLGYLTQVILNLLSNVERYAYPTGGGGRVDITLADGPAGREPSYIVRVRDYGVGIPAANLGRVFDPFFTTGRSKGGTGLGMAIVYNLVTTGLKGTISLQSTLGEGTEAIVTLPRVVPN